jgi:hypothetical protein
MTFSYREVDVIRKENNCSHVFGSGSEVSVRCPPKPRPWTRLNLVPGTSLTLSTPSHNRLTGLLSTLLVFVASFVLFIRPSGHHVLYSPHRLCGGRILHVFGELYLMVL